MSFTVAGVDGWLHLLAFLLFLVAAVAAFLRHDDPSPAWRPRVWPLCVAAALCLEALAQIVH